MKTKITTCFPHYYLITADNFKKDKIFLDNLAICLENGISLVQLRSKSLSVLEYKNLANDAIKLCHKYNAKLILNNYVQMVEELNADGVHLTSSNLLSCKTRPLNENYIVSASCHNKIELMHAQQIQLDFVTLSPVLKTMSHPDIPPLGWKQFQQLAKLVDLPIFALGGLKQKELECAIKYGAHGVSGISAFWGEQSI
ncbi:MAG: thiamine-phosphate pyrophosphorylase [Pseudomonadota bacterium]|nr:thiamine-phosphate pyrophosphorylase [Pseudomonadota bacterium]